MNVDFDVFPKNIKDFIRNFEIRLISRFYFVNNNKEKVKEEDENLAYKIITSIFNYIWRNLTKYNIFLKSNHH